MGVFCYYCKNMMYNFEGSGEVINPQQFYIDDVYINFTNLGVIPRYDEESGFFTEFIAPILNEESKSDLSSSVITRDNIKIDVDGDSGNIILVIEYKKQDGGDISIRREFKASARLVEKYNREIKPRQEEDARLSQEAAELERSAIKNIAAFITDNPGEKYSVERWTALGGEALRTCNGTWKAELAPESQIAITFFDTEGNLSDMFSYSIPE